MDHVPGLRSRAGFSLAELMVVVAISTLTLGLAMDVLMTMTREMERVQTTTRLHDEALLLSDHLGTLMVATGGGVVRPWMAVAVENDWASDGSDRLTWAVATDPTRQCGVAELDGQTLHVDAPGDCCLWADAEGSAVILVSSDSDGNDHWIARNLGEVDEANCTVQVLSGTSPLDRLPDDADAWTHGTVADVRIRTLWLDDDDDLLMEGLDRDRDGVAETRIVADRVLDLQAALGYDVPPWDWRSTDGADTGDEWLFNATNDTFGANDGQGLGLARVADLRMVQVGIIVGAPDVVPRASASEQLLDGPPRSRDGWILRAHLGTVSLRNDDIMR